MSRLCDECGGPLPEADKIEHSFFIACRDRQFCSRACAWVNSYKEACSKTGVRPSSPAGAWGWACRQALKRCGPKCTNCGKKLGELCEVNGETWLSPSKDEKGYILVDAEGSFIDGYAEYHHIIPLILGGNSLPENLIVLCSECHRDQHKPGWKKNMGKRIQNKKLQDFSIY
jgi:5-methylcytosine-specific restriction endonuclease McrA